MVKTLIYGLMHGSMDLPWWTNMNGISCRCLVVVIGKCPLLSMVINRRIILSISTQIQNTVHNIKIHNQRQHDFWVWTPNSNGHFSMKSAWNHIGGIHIEFKWIGIIQNEFCAPKMSVYSLLAYLNKLNTKGRVYQWNNNIDQTCVLYLKHNEDRIHLFFNCSYSRQILDEIMQKLKINTGNSYEINYILDILCENQRNTENQLINVAITTVIWHIWCERNDRIFKNIILPAQARLKLITQDCKLLMPQNINLKPDNSEKDRILADFGIAFDQARHKLGYSQVFTLVSGVTSSTRH